MSMNRRQALGAFGAATALSLTSARAFAQEGPITVSALYDQSGGLESYGQPIVDALRFAVDEQNAKGGLLGREVKLNVYDPQTNMQLYAQFARQAALSDKPAVVFAGITSASREVVRPIMRQFNTLYFYANQYEGGVCDRNMFATGVTPGQTVEKLVDYSVKNNGGKVYIVAADYNYGQIIADWVKKYTADHGGEVLGVEFFPMDVTDFKTSISKIQAAKPDYVWSALVGGAHISFYRQWKAAGMLGKIPMSSTTFAGGNEHVILTPEESDGIMVCQNYLQELDNPLNQQFVADFHAKFGADYPYITELGMGAYQGFRLWAAGVEKAGTIDRLPVIEALETGISLDAPSGRVTIDPKTHHTTMDVHIARVENGGLIPVETFEQQPPADTALVCDLVANPDDNQQYVIDF
ncbi:ABC transporter substrate-binding protein [Rhodobacter sp. 24-YEA-8]|uniref:urea ABC transporter substrate-binding protein n=1 Tax=Rhodobacter sp. 24-YEA-8 TaxID=1884310 RepID=UPI00089C7DE3|nr:ABC transporter substrate-binding protein [Rhodobacter sp. 24-YEA-8]SED87872.1 amino acid/amide ABC transporter substrate-binding protein, HAAT family [Rhodobacter sp. 24-YEA-8]